MKNQWIINSLISGLVSLLLTYFYTRNIKISIIAFVIIFLIVLILNPVTRYMKAFYAILFPLLNKLFFEIDIIGDNYHIVASLKELDWISIIFLGILAILCLILDFKERNGKLSNISFGYKKNSIGDINGNNNNINQK